MESITRLNKKDIPFVWGDEQEKAFTKLKQLMADEPVRRIYDPKLPLELHTDASTVGLGAILIQNGHPIGYYSRKLNDAETRYTPTELECLAVVDAIKYFQIYLEGTYLQGGHRPLRSSMALQLPEHKTTTFPLVRTSFPLHFRCDP